MKTLLKTLRFLLSLLRNLLVASVAMALLFASSTTTGLRMALDAVSDATHGLIRYEGASGRLLGHISFQRFVYEDENVMVEVQDARLRLNLPALLLKTVQARDLTAARVRVAVKETPPTDTPYLTHLPFDLLVDDGAVELFQLKATETSDWLDFRKLDMAVTWRDDLIQIRRAHLDFSIFGRLSATGKLRFLPDGLRIEDAQLKGPGDFSVGMFIGYDNHFTLDTQWANLRYPFVGDAFLHSPKGRAHAQGPWSGYDYQVQGQLLTQGLSFDAKAAGHGNLDGLNILTLSSSALGGSLVANGDLQWLPALHLEVSGHAMQLNPAVQWPQWPGVLNGRFELTTTLLHDQPLLAFNAALTQTRLRGYNVSAQVEGRWTPDTLDLEELQLTSGNSRLWARGRALPPFDLDAKLDSPDLEELWPAFTGNAVLKARLRGTADTLTVSVHGQGHQLGFGGLSAKDVAVHAELDAQKNLQLDMQAKDVDAGVTLRALQLHGSGTTAQHQVKLQADGPQGAVQLQAEGALDLKTQHWSGTMTEAQILPKNLKPWVLEDSSRFEVTPDGVRIEPTCWHSDSSRACAQIHRTAKAGTTGVAFRLDDFNLAYFQALLPKGWALSGQISGTGDLLTRDLNSMTLDLRSTAGSLMQGSRALIEFQPAQLQLGPDGNSILAQLSLPLKQGHIEMNARLADARELAQRPLSGQIKLDVPSLQWLTLLSPEIESADGRIEGTVRLGGTAGSPQYDGAVEWLDGKLKLSTPGITLAPLHLALTGSSASTLTLSGDATSGEGTLKLQGTLDPTQKDTQVALTLQGDHFRAFNTPEARLWISPQLQVNLQGRTLQVDGTIKVPKAQITPTTFDTGIAPTSDQVIVRPTEDDAATPDSPLQLRSSIRIELGDDVRFDGLGLKTQLTGGITATDEPGQPTRGRGEINLQGGQYKAYGQDLSIETGKLLFNDSPITQPAVELRATRKPTDDITVGVSVRGRLDAPEFSLFSTPAMPQERQLSWLVLGRALDDQTTSADRSKVSDAALSLGLSGGGYFANKLGQKVGIDSVTIGAKPGQTTDQAQLTLGKYLSPKLFVSYGVGLFQRGYTVRLQYDVGRGFKLQTETGIESGGDILYTIER